MAFLGAVALVGATAFLLHSCNKKFERREQKDAEEQPSTAKVNDEKQTSKKKKLPYI